MALIFFEFWYFHEVWIFAYADERAHFLNMNVWMCALCVICLDAVMLADGVFVGGWIAVWLDATKFKWYLRRRHIHIKQIWQLSSESDYETHTNTLWTIHIPIEITWFATKRFAVKSLINCDVQIIYLICNNLLLFVNITRDDSTN